MTTKNPNLFQLSRLRDAEIAAGSDRTKFRDADNFPNRVSVKISEFGRVDANRDDSLQRVLKKWLCLKLRAVKLHSTRMLTSDRTEAINDCTWFY